MRFQKGKSLWAEMTFLILHDSKALQKLDKHLTQARSQHNNGGHAARSMLEQKKLKLLATKKSLVRQNTSMSHSKPNHSNRSKAKSNLPDLDMHSDTPTESIMTEVSSA